jgi:Ni,Fe-hydrogenase III large subunit
MTHDRIARLLAEAHTIAPLKPWPRYEVDHGTFGEIGCVVGEGERELFGLWAEPGMVHMAIRAIGESPCVVSTAVVDDSFPSIGRSCAPAIRLERTIRDLYGYQPKEADDLRPWLDHGAWEIAEPLGARTACSLRDPADYDFLAVHGEGLHQIPVGPVHAGIIEPGHFRFTCNGEIVARLEERLGYVHKGIDALTTDVPLEQAARVVARLSGDSTVAASFAFARAVEAALAIAVPPRGAVVRGVMAELERLANHLGDIGAICNDAAFALIHAHCGILRERVLAASDAVFGHRLMMDIVVPGGAAENITADGAREIVAMLDAIAPTLDDIVRVYDETPSLQDRTCNTGYLAPELAKRFAAGGLVGRASGRDFDSRRDLAYPPYGDKTFDVPLLIAGDVDARVRVRIGEVFASMALMREFLSLLPEGPILAPVPQPKEGAEGIAITEAFRGDILVWLRIMPNLRVARCHVRDASWFQWPLLEAVIKDNIVADFPLCNKSFNCSYSGHDL